MTITRVKLENFTVFESLDLEPSPGINVLVGANGTGKTHLLKVCYAACGTVVSGHRRNLPDRNKAKSEHVAAFRQVTRQIDWKD